MKVCPYIWFLLLLLISGGLWAQGELYQHPVFDISFEATPNWAESYPGSDSFEYSVVHPNHNMKISLRFIPECKRPKKIFRQLSGLTGLICFRGAYDTILNGQEALVMKGNCIEGMESYSNMIIGFPKENGLYLMEISCPDNCTAAHRKRVNTILQTVRIGPDLPG